MSSPLGAFIQIQDDATKHPPLPPNSNGSPPTPLELDAMPLGPDALYTGPSLPAATLQPNGPASASAPLTPQPPPSAVTATTGVVQAWNQPRANQWRLLSTFVVFFGNGCNDSAPGALLPYMEAYYGVGYAIVSMVFIANAAGFILAAFFVHAVDARLGRARTFMACEVVVLVGYVMMVVTPPFPAFVIGFFVTGYGIATGLALNNVFGANLARSTVILGFMHGSYGVGGIVAPIMATSMVSNGILFSRFYLILLCIRIVAFFATGWSFWHFERDNKPPPTLLDELERTAGRRAASEDNQPTKLQQLKISLKNRTTLIGAMFIFAYQGAEVSISGWVISFLINYRGSDPKKVGYVTAGFWGGITLGRFTLSHLAHRVGEKTFTYFLVAGAIGFQALVWFVPNVIGDSVAVALIGLLLGPVYPAATVIFSRLLPRHIQNTALAFISSAGSSGGAIAPFVTGIMAQVTGTWVLHPVCISLFVVMEVCWFVLPKVAKRTE